jgi:uncharacterized membrane protein YphA (DoxX/SURF4 family)
MALRNRGNWNPVDPIWVDRILDWPWTWRIARIALTIPFVVSALMKLSDMQTAALEQESVGLHPGVLWACLTIFVELVGPALLIAGRLVWLGAGMLSVFTLLAAVLAHDFWNMSGAMRVAETNVFLEHIALIAGFVLAALVAEHEARVDVRSKAVSTDKGRPGRKG